MTGASRFSGYMVSTPPPGGMDSPPMAAYGGSGTAGAPNVYRSLSTDSPGVMSVYTDFVDFSVVDECFNPVLSPDGTKILFEGDASGNIDIWVVDNIPGSTPTQVTSSANIRMHPAWHPDSDLFVFVSCSGGAGDNGAVRTTRVSSPGSLTTLKTPTSGWGCWRPHFNFDGTRVAYIMDKITGAGCDLRVMDDDGTNDAAVDTTLTGYRTDGGPQHSWARTQNKIAYETGGSPGTPYVINDDGTGRTQLNTSGVAVGLPPRFSEFAWTDTDSFILFTADVGGGGVFHSMVRAETDGSNTTELNNAHGASHQTRFRGGLIFDGRIWFIESTFFDPSGNGVVSSMALDGTDYQVNFDSSLGTGDQVFAFTNGDGWYFN